MLELFAGLALVGCGLMILAVALPLPFRHAESVHHIGLIAAVLGAMGLFFIWQEAVG